MIFLHRRSFAGAFHDRKEVQSLQQRQALGLIRQSFYLEPAPYSYPVGTTLIGQPACVLLPFLTPVCRQFLMFPGVFFF